MRTGAVARHAGLLLASLVTTSAADEGGREYSRLQGTWRFALVEVDGARQPDPPFESNKLIISKEGRYTIIQGSRITRGSLKLDPTQTPKHYDVTITEGPNKGLVTLGIYEVAGDTYRICLPLRGKDRPSSFVSKPGSGLLLFAFKREERDPSPALVGVARREMAGTWQAVTYAVDGEPASEEELATIKVTIDLSGQVSAVSDGNAFITGTTRIDPTQSPMTIDVTYTGGDLKGQTALGIYRIDDDVLTICRAAPGKARPTEFASTPGSGLTLMTYRAEKVP